MKLEKYKKDNSNIGIDKVDKNKRANNLGTSIGIIDIKADNLNIGIENRDKKANNLSISIVDIDKETDNLNKRIEKITGSNSKYRQ